MNNVKVSTFLIMALCCSNPIAAQADEQNSDQTEQRITVLEETLQHMTKKQKYMPQIHGILRGKFEYEPDLNEGRFEVRNARLAAEGNLPFRSSYKLEVDLCDESVIKMKDAWVRLNIPLTGKDSRPSASADLQNTNGWSGSSLRVTLGQQRMPFSIDAHRNPSAQYFANRSFIAKQVGDMRDVGAAVGYDLLYTDSRQTARKVISFDAGIYNGSNLDNQKTAWFSSPAYSARLQYFPIKGLAIIPSVQHQLIANREASYTSMDMGANYEWKGLHIEAEFLRKFYAHNAFSDCNAVNAMAIYRQNMKHDKTFLDHISYLLRYDYMDNHSDGKKGFVTADGISTGTLQLTDAERHRLTMGLTFSVRNKFFPTDIRINYEKYWYPHNGTPKESEQDKLVAELMIRF